MSQQLRERIEAAGVTRYRIAKETSVSQSALSRFASGECMLRLEHVDALCLFLGLELTPAKATKKQAPARREEK